MPFNFIQISHRSNTNIYPQTTTINQQAKCAQITFTDIRHCKIAHNIQSRFPQKTFRDWNALLGDIVCATDFKSFFHWLETIGECRNFHLVSAGKVSINAYRHTKGNNRITRKKIFFWIFNWHFLFHLLQEVAWHNLKTFPSKPYLIQF